MPRDWVHGLPLYNSTSVIKLSQFTDFTPVFVTYDDELTLLQGCLTTYVLVRRAKLNWQSVVAYSLDLGETEATTTGLDLDQPSPETPDSAGGTRSRSKRA